MITEQIKSNGVPEVRWEEYNPTQKPEFTLFLSLSCVIDESWEIRGWYL
jgi:hypothetical protein